MRGPRGLQIMMVDRSPHSRKGGDPGDAHLDLHTRLDLLHDLLPPDEKRKALAHLAICPTCEERFHRRLTHHEILRTGKVPQTADGPLAWSGRVRQFQEKPTPGLWRRLRDAVAWPPVRYAGVLAGAAVILLLVLPMQREDRGQDLQLTWLPPVGERITFRDSTLTREDEDVAAGFEAYARRDLGQATELLAGAEVSGAYEILRKTYLGSALAWNGHHEQAVSVLQTIAPEKLPEDYDEALWALYVSLRRLGRDDAADSLLIDLVRRGDSVAERARAELE
jgi:hypothetical protein